MKKFVILAQPRTGTNALVSRLNLIQEVKCHYEVFHKQEVYLSKQLISEEKLPKLLSVENRDVDPAKFLDELIIETQSSDLGNIIFGFKIFFGHNRQILDHVLADDNWIKIIVFRPNLLEQYLSEKIASVTGQYVMTDLRKDNVKGGAVKVKFEYKDFKKFVKKEREIINYYVKNSRGKCEFISMEQAVKGDLNWFTNLCEIRDTIDHINPTIKKQNPSSMDKKVENIQYLKKELQGTEFEWMII
jgi:hypothetical protein